MSIVFPKPILPEHQEDENVWEDDEIQRQSRLRQLIAQGHDVINQNTGLLLVVAAMVFFSMMDVAVIKLHKTDPPVTTLQVRLSSFVVHKLVAELTDFMRCINHI